MNTQQTQTIAQICKCDQCDWVGKNARALAVHKGRVHKKVDPAPAQPETKPVQQPEPAAEPPVAQTQAPTPEAQKQPAEQLAEPPVAPAETEPSEEIPSLTPPMEAPQILDPKILGIKEILEGSVLKLQGNHYIFNEDAISGPEVAEGIEVKVNFRWMDQGQGQYYLRAKAEGGSQQWVIAENDVLESRSVQLLSLGGKEVPPNYVPAVPSAPPAEELPQVQEGPTEEELAQKKQFFEALRKYAEYRDAKLEAEKAFKEVDQEARPLILDYLGRYGTESEEGRGDKVLVADGLRTHYTFTPGETYVQRNESKILDYLISNAIHIGLTSTVNWDVWEKLKANGTIPASFIAEVEVPAQKPDYRKLIVEKDQTFEG